MLYNIFAFEIRYRLKRPATYVYFFILFFMAFLSIYSSHVNIGEASGLVNRNSPYTINMVVMVMMIFGTMICSAVMGVPVFRDYEYGFHEIIFTTPVKKWEYLGGRFLGSYCIAVFIFSGLLFGNMIGSVFPGINSEHIGPFMLKSYLKPFIVFIIPNLFMLGILFYSMGSLFRSQLAIYVQGVVLFALYLVIVSNQKDIEHSRIASVLDPFGWSAASNMTRYWTVTEKNTMTIPFTGLLLYNRLLWLCISMAIGGLFYKLFSFSASGFVLKRKNKPAAEKKEVAERISIPLVTCSDSLKSRFKRWLFLVKFDFKGVILAIPFLIIASCGMLILFSNGLDIGNVYGTSSLPVTYMILELLTENFMLFIVIIITFYSGEIIWKEINAKLANIIDAIPMSNALTLTSKFTAMILVEILLLIVLMLAGIIIQTLNGFYDYQVIVYIKYFSLITFPYLVFLTFLTFFIHILVNNKFLGHTLVILFWVARIFLASYDINHKMLWYASRPSVSYSAMNGFGHFVFPLMSFNFYWLFLGIAMLMAGLLMMKRGSEIDFKSRFNKIKSNLRYGNTAAILICCMTLFFLCGGFIYYNTNVMNVYKSPGTLRKEAAEYEIKYRKYSKMELLRITSVTVQVDLFPQQRIAKIKGTYVLKNKSQHAIDTLIVTEPEGLAEDSLSFSASTEELIRDKNQGLRMYRFKNKLLPGDSIEFYFEESFVPKGFTNEGGTTDIVYNGTFINNRMMPQFGYDESRELSEDDRRKDEGLPKKLYRMNPISDTAEYKNIYVVNDADWIRYEAIVSTDSDQIALSPGYLQKEWTENGRRYFHYKMDSPIWNFFSFLSARYEVLRDKYQDVTIEIYYHKEHDYNIKTMVKAIKKTLEYGNKNFSPYQHKQVRIIEFPRYNLFAQSFPNTIPFSEGIGFILDVDKESDIDMAFYVTAHEVGHQWWAHQVCGANVQGSTMLVESMAQYTALMVMEHEYGKAHIEKFLKYELDRYLEGRSAERKREQPLMLNENQQYIHYRKGSLVLYALKDYIGEDKINQAFAKFLKDYAFKDGPYPTAIDFVRYIKAVTPDSLRYVVEDMCETITLYNNKTNAYTYTKNNNGTFRVSLEVECHKYRADSIGNEKEINVTDWIDIGIYTALKNGKDSLLFLEKRKLKKGANSFEIIVNGEPSKAGIDPLHKLIDRNSGDNTKSTTGS